MGELIGATESVSPIVALVFPFIPVLILLGFWAAAGGGFVDDDDDDEPRGCLLYTSPSPRDRG